jgi:hypothetical protein
MITQEEKAALRTRPLRKESPVRSMLMHMQVNEVLLIEPKDWTWTSGGPSHLCRRVEEKTAMRFLCEKVLPPGAGWVITRTQ